MFIITGIGRSGTSFTARVLSEAGARFNSVWFDKDIKAGMEADVMAYLNNEIMHNKAASVDEAIANLGIEDIRKDLVKGIFIKDPRFLLTVNEWLESEYDIEHIIYCRRDYREIYESSATSGHGIAGNPEEGIVILTYSGFVTCFSYMEKRFFETAKRSGVPVTVLDYPKSVLDFSEIEKLGALVDPGKLKDAWEKVRNPDKLREPNAEFSSIWDIISNNLKEISELEQALAEKDGFIESQKLRYENIIAKQQSVMAKYESRIVYIPWLKNLERSVRKKIIYPVKNMFKGSKSH